MDSKGQSSIEVLLLIGGAIMVATIVGIYLKGTLPSIQNRINDKAANLINP